MKILIDSYNECFQNDSGGVRIKIESYFRYISKMTDAKLFNKWTDKITDFDLLHVFKPGVQNYASISLAKRNGLPVVVSSIVPSENKHKVQIKKVIDHFISLNTPYRFIKKIFNMADAVIAETVFEKEYLEYAYNISKDKIYVIPNGVSFPEANVGENYFFEQTGIPKDFVLQVGRFDENKNQLSTIKAVQGTDIHVVFIGGPDKDDTSYYDKCVENSSDNIHFLGWVSHDDPLLQAAYMACHSFILPSHSEILGNALIEAASFGANIISTNVLPLNSWGIEDKCFVVNPADISDIRDKLIKSQNQEKSRILSEVIKHKFDWNAIVDEHYQIYRRLLND